MLLISGKLGKHVSHRERSEVSAGFSQATAISRDGSVVLRIVKQPESQHRARYLTEGSRGSVKDKTGSSFPTVTIEGVQGPTKLQIFVGSELGHKPSAHLFYQVCRVPGKSPASCAETRSQGTNYLELSSEHRPGGRGNTFVCDCIGILKERFSDVEGRFPNDSAWKEEKRKSTHCRLVFKTTVETSSGNLETLQVVSDLINCTQLPGTPEILKTNTKISPAVGGGELWIIGKNFLKDTKVNFVYVKPGKVEPTWSKVVSPLKEYFHPNHLIVKIPAFYTSLYHDVQVQVVVRSSGKTSEAITFTYKASELSHDAGKISVIRTVKSVNNPSSKPTILEPVDQRQTEPSKRARVDLATRRTQSSPRLHTIRNYRARNSETSLSPSPWRTIGKLERRGSSGENSSDDSSNMTSPSAIPVPAPVDMTSNLTMDFTEFFQAKRNELRNSPVSVCANNFEVVAPAPGSATSVQEKTTTTDLDNNAVVATNSEATTNVSIEETSEEKATIAISLPASILTNQVHMKNIMETLNTTFCKTDSEVTQDTGCNGTRKRAYSEYDAEMPMELPCVTPIITDPDMSAASVSDPASEEAEEWRTQELKTIEDKKWNEDINEILETVMEEPMNFVPM